MAYHQQYNAPNTSATFVPGGFDDYYAPPVQPELMAPKPERINPEMSTNIASGIQNMDLSRESSVSYAQHPNAGNNEPHLSPFPKLTNPPPNVPQSDDELEQTLENARVKVLNSNDPEVQLAWAADALVYAGVCADNEERLAAAKPHAARSSTPRLEHQLKQDAMNVVTFLADQHHPKAEFLRGMWLEWGRFGHREDKKEAFRCYSRAADRGYARAEYRIGMLYESYNDPAKALRHYHRGVEAGDSASCYRLGMMTLRGQHGQQLDYARGIDLIRRSAQSADENAAQGAYVYGMLLAKELPQMDIPDAYLQRDERQAKMNLEKSAYLKFAKAQLKMGSAYELGSLGCEFNPALSMHYSALAAKQGEAEADMALSKWFLVGSEGVFPKNEELAFTYAERAAQSDLATAEFALGYFHEIGVYVSVDLDKAMEWYIKASRHGNEDAQGRIDGLERKQVLNKKDHQKVAVQRIQSMHGSMRGQRPAYGQQQPSRLAQVSSPIDEISSPSSIYSQAVDGTHFNSPTVVPPPRGSSITPYPEDDRPPTIQPAEYRSQSVAPYPLEDGPPKNRLGPTGGFFNANPPPRPATTLNPDTRPSSAFQLSPDMRPSATNQYPGRQPYPGQQPYHHEGGPPPGQRPATAQPYDPRFRPTPGQRVASGPAGAQNFHPQQGVPSPAPLAPRPPMPNHQATAPGAPQQIQKIDIGFSAPADDRRHRTYGPARPVTNAGGAPVPSAQAPAPAPAPAPLKPSSSMPVMESHPAQPGRASAASSRPGSARPPVAEVPKLPKKDAAPVAPPAKPTASAAGAKPAAAAARPPGKGPKTFDEMGVPAQQKDGDCVIM